MLRVVMLPRGKGKTKKLIEWMCEALDDIIRIYVGHSKQAAMEALRMYRHMKRANPALPDLTSPQFISMVELSGHRIPTIHTSLEYGFDNTDLILRGFLRGGNASLGMFTFTGEWKDDQATVIHG